MTDKKPLFEILGPYEIGWKGAVCTRNGMPARVLCDDRKKLEWPVVAAAGKMEGTIITAMPDGRNMSRSADDAHDLMRARVVADEPILVGMRHGKPVCILSPDKAFPTDCDVVSFTPDALVSAAMEGPADIPTDAPAAETRRVIPPAGTLPDTHHRLFNPETALIENARWTGDVWYFGTEIGRQTPEKLAELGFLYRGSCS